jgi:DNA-binding SARP family transcriptional activator
MRHSNLIDTGSRRNGGVDAPELRLALLKGFELSYGADPVSLPMSAQRLVAFLALRDRSMLRVHVATTLWPDSTEERSVANLRTALWRIRYEQCDAVHATATHLRLSPSVIVDYRLSVARARRLLDPSGQFGLDELDESHFVEDLLPDWYDEWVVLERERYRQLRLYALESAAERLVTAGRAGRAIQAALIAVCEEPLRESAQRALVRAHLARGNQGEAILQYRRYRKALYDELQVSPSPLFEQLLLGMRDAGASGGVPEKLSTDAEATA